MFPRIRELRIRLADYTPKFQQMILQELSRRFLQWTRRVFFVRHPILKPRSRPSLHDWPWRSKI